MRFRIFALTLLLSVLTTVAEEKEVTVRNVSASLDLAGTLSLPDEDQPHAFVVFASGSGKQNRDEEVMGHKPFKVLSDALVSEGYATLRMDDRGEGKSEGKFEDAVLDDLTGDVLAGVDYVRQLYPDARVGILGHSQGGEIAVKAAAADKVDFIITLAAPAWPGDSIVMSQCRALAVATTGSWPMEGLERELLDIAKSNLPSFVVLNMAVEAYVKHLGEKFNDVAVRAELYKQVAPITTPMYRDLLRSDPSEDIKSVSVPWLALNGDKDLQVISGNLETIAELCPSATTVVMPGHNHLFQKAVTGLPGEYPTAGQSPSEETVTAILDWMKSLTH